MTSADDLNDYRRRAIETLKENAPFIESIARATLGVKILAVYIIGSVLDRKRFTGGSDIDVGIVVSGEPIGISENLSEQLQQEMIRHPLGELGVINTSVFLGRLTARGPTLQIDQPDGAKETTIDPMTEAAPATYESTVRATLVTLGSKDPDAEMSSGFWRHCESAGISPEVAAATMYSGTNHRHNVTSTTLAEESPTREEWEVVVRRTGSMNSIVEAAGRKPDEVVDRNVVFGDFYDDERAVAFARKMTRAGFVAMTGPRKPLVGLNEVSEPEAAEKSVYRWTEIWWQYPKDATRFADYLEKGHSTIVAMAFNRIVRTNASPGDVRKVIGKHRWEGKYILDPKTLDVAADGDPSAMSASEPVEVIHEPAAAPQRIPWIKVERDPAKHAEYAAYAERYGVIKSATQVYAVCGADMMKEDQEVFLVLPLNLRGELKAPPYEVARGQRSKVTIEAVDVLRAATDAGAEGYVVVHNHPSGKVKPSAADLRLTDNIKKATAPYGKGLCLVDHVIVGNAMAYSIFEKRLYKCP